MSNPVKAAFIIGAFILAAVALWIYFSPYHSCVRSAEAQGLETAGTICAAAAIGDQPIPN
jgi:hypothetical protein